MRSLAATKLASPDWSNFLTLRFSTHGDANTGKVVKDWMHFILETVHYLDQVSKQNSHELRLLVYDTHSRTIGKQELLEHDTFRIPVDGLRLRILSSSNFQPPRVDPHLFGMILLYRQTLLLTLRAWNCFNVEASQVKSMYCRDVCSSPKIHLIFPPPSNYSQQSWIIKMEIVGRWMNLTTSASNTASPAMVSIWGIPTTAPWPRSQAKCKAVWPNLSDLVTPQSGHDRITKTLSEMMHMGRKGMKS